jgi:tRNA (cytidine32/uridine32-2'-O)-methyltransferase
MYDNIRMVMVNTTHPGNIGAAARALKNMGMSRLVLVDPLEYPSQRATWRAASAVDVMDKIQVVSTLDEAVADCSLVIGTSARERRIPWPLLTPRECGDRVWVEAAQHQVAVVFGREDRGLTNEELHKCHFHVHIPANPEYSSLNVAAALQVIAYEVRMSALAAEQGGTPVHFDDWDQPLAPLQDVEMYFAHLEETLTSLSFLTADNPRQTVTRLRRLYNRVRLDQMELGILRGMLTSVQNHLFHSGNKIAALEARVRELEQPAIQDRNNT